MKNREKLFGLYFDNYNIEETLDYIQKHKNKCFRYIVTPNVDHIIRIQDTPDTTKFYQEADLSVCDSRILVKLANKLDIKISDVVTGSDLTQQLFSKLIKPTDEITVIGGSERMMAKVLSKYKVKACHHYNPPMGFINNPSEMQKTVDYVLSHNSPYVFFAVGSPQQEKVAYLLKLTGKAKGIGFCIGASLLFLSGDERRAPKWIQNLSLEWLYRLLQNPRRLLKRYLVDDMKIFKLYLKEKKRKGL